MRFDFGRNWAEFSQGALTPDLVAQARADFTELFNGVEVEGKTFLDIGFGQGLSLLSAAASGARVVGCDIDPLCAQVLRRNARLFPEIFAADDIPLIVGSILDPETDEKLRSLANCGFDIVHAWGVLHHTGDMRRAIRLAAAHVSPRGHLVVAIYNRHWSSPAWRRIKSLYCRLPQSARKPMVRVFYPMIWIAKLAVTRQIPTRKKRGMDFYYDVVDWVGGYPYEYASAEEVQSIMRDSGFECVRHRAPQVLTGCNEFLFRKAQK